MLLLGLDLETGGAFNGPAEENFITEIGLVLWDTEFRQPVDLLSLLLKSDQPLSEEAAEYTGITQELLDRHGKPLDIRTLQPVARMMEKADFIVAHNGRDFDRPLLVAAFERYKLPMPAKQWLDTLHDVDYPRNCVSKNLTYLAGFHGMVNPFPHRAVTDVLTMLTILGRYDLEAVIAASRQPWMVVQAMVSFEDKDKAKAKGFRWENEAGRSYKKCWVKRIREDRLEALQGSCDFPVSILERL